MSAKSQAPEPTLAETTQRTLRLSQAVMDRLENMAARNQLDTYDVEALSAYSELLAKVMRAQTGLLKEWRAQVKDTKRIASNLSREQVVAVVSKYIGTMPLDELEAHVQSVQELLDDRRRGDR